MFRMLILTKKINISYSILYFLIKFNFGLRPWSKTIVDMKPKLISAVWLQVFEASRPCRNVVFLDKPVCSFLFLFRFVFLLSFNFCLKSSSFSFFSFQRKALQQNASVWMILIPRNALGPGREQTKAD